MKDATRSLAQAIKAGNRRALAKAVTLVESTRAADRIEATALRAALAGRGDAALRIGLTGTPGVGKSTFIEAFGRHLTSQGKRVAVLAVDPSSARTGGSILGDKTRMPELSRDPNAFIRPTPSRSTLGGVADQTRAVIDLCAAAGFDVILVETVGVGQSETMVAGMTDIFALLIAPAGGDELQGVKRGIMELAEIVLVNKADGDLAAQATRTAADYAGALRLMRRMPGTPDGFPKVKTISATEGQGLAEVWQDMRMLAAWRDDNGITQTRRAAQRLSAFHEAVERQIMAHFATDAALKSATERAASRVETGAISPENAAADLLATAFGGPNPNLSDDE